ncbi:bifunctional DNA primase/polymerase, partial [Xanthobacter flavus]
MTPLDHALDYARRGWRVFPCNPTPRRGFSKVPLIGCDKDDTGKDIKDTGWKLKATTDEAQIREWWARWPGALIGVPMGRESGVWAIDPDGVKEEGDPDGMAAWESIASQHQPIRTHTHLTPNGGRHILFRWRDDRPMTNTERGFRAHGARGINVRGEGGYVIAPGSRLSDGRSYAMEDPMDFFHFAEAPDWLYAMFDPPTASSSPQRSANVVDFRGQRQAPPDRYVQTAIAGECWALAQSGRGERNNRLNAAAFSLGQLVGAGLVDEDTVRGSLLQAAGNCGLIADDGERPVLATIESGLAAGRLKPREVSDRQEHRHEMRGTGTDGPAPAPQSMRRDRQQMAEPLEVVCAADLA